LKEIFVPAYRALILRLQRRRRELGYNQTRAGQLAGRSRQWIGKIETCEIRLDVVHFVRLCHAYRLSPPRLVAWLAEELSTEDDSFYPLASGIRQKMLAIHQFYVTLIVSFVHLHLQTRCLYDTHVTNRTARNTPE